MTHRHSWAEPPYKCVEIDPHVCLQPMTGGGEGISTATGQPVPEYPAGFMFSHDRDGLDERCEGFVRTHPDGERPAWTITGSLEGGDLTLSPSILCKAGSVENPMDGSCGFHGWVREGKWVPA